MPGPTPRDPEERFVERIGLADDGCWPWLGSVQTTGYGQFYLTRNGREATVGAHRFAYERSIGPIPEGMQLDHLCRNRACVNPDHLEPVTVRQNVLRGEAPSVVLWRTNRCKQGHDLNEHGYIRPDGRGRQCRHCANDRAKERRRSSSASC